MNIMPGLEWLFGDPANIPDPLGRGQEAVEFARCLKHPSSTAPDKKMNLDLWQENFIRRVLGPVDEHGDRLVQTVYLQVGKGSRKTTLAAIMALIFTYGPEREDGGPSYVIAADKAQARVAFEEALAMIRQVPRLTGSTRPIDSKNRLFHERSGAFFEALASGGAKLHGRTPSLVLVDELWSHQNSKTWDSMRENSDKKDTTLTIITTTAGRGNESPDYAYYDYAKRVQAGDLDDPSFLPVVFEASRDDPWDSEETWHKVLPGLRSGYPSLKKTRLAVRRAKEIPSERAGFEQFKLGIRQDNSLSPFVDMRVFDEGKAEIDLEAMAGRECFLAVDMSTTTDLSGVVACFPDDDGGYDVAAWAFVPEEALQARADRDGVPYPRWAEEGWLIPTPGEVIDYGAIERHIRGLCDRFDVREIDFDPAYAQPVMGPLTDDGYPVATMRQGWFTQSPALNILERAIISRKLRWDSPVLRWCIENVAIHADTAGNRTMHKGKSRDRIDLAVCFWMAVSRAAAGDVTTSFYSRPESEVLEFSAF